MLTRKTADTFAVSITIKGQGVTQTMDVVYHNRKLEDIQAVLQLAQDNLRMQDDFEYANRETLLFMIASWDAEYPLTNEGIKEAESDWPGLIAGLGHKYHEARQVEVVKN
jgi:hypothetical protein